MASYLSRLTFPPQLARGPIAAYIKNIRLVILLTLTIILAGIAAYFQLPKRLNPEIKIPIITVSSVLPGAGPADVEKLVTVPIENNLRGLKGLDTITSVSLDNVSFTTLQFFSRVNRDDAKDLVQSAVDTVHDLPANAQTPVVTALDFEDVPIWEFVVSTPKSYPDLMNFSENLKQKIDDLPKVDRVTTTGADTQEIVVEVDPVQLSNYGLNPLQLSTAIQKAQAAYPAGNVTSTNNVFTLSIDSQVQSIEDIRKLPISVGNQTVLLGDIASVQSKSKPNQQQSILATNGQQPQPAVTFYVYKTSDVNIDEAATDVKKVVDEAVAEQKNEYSVTTIINTSDEITKQFDDLLSEFGSTILLVFGCLFLFLGLRQALIASFTVPLTFFSAFVFMLITGMTINFLSLFAFLLALGLIVDDTIVVVSAMTSYYKSGRFTPLQTGLLVWRDTIVPIWSTTITTIWSFIPLLIASGIIGEFIKPIPIVVTVTMISSTGIAVLITLPLMIVLLKLEVPQRVRILVRILAGLVVLALGVVLFYSNPLFPLLLALYILVVVVAISVRTPLLQWFSRPAITERLSRYSNHGIITVDGFAAWYKRQILKILKSKSSRRKVVIAIVAYAIFSFSLLPLGLVKNEFFPKSDQNQFFLTLELPTGTTLNQTKVASQEILAYLTTIPGNEFVIAEVGKTGAQDAALDQSSNQAFFTVRLVDKAKRKHTSVDLAQQVRDHYKGYQTGTLSIIEETGGPPAGSDLQINLSGPDLAVLNNYADNISNYLTQQPGVTNIQKSIKAGTSKLTFVPDPVAVQNAGLTPDVIGFTMRLLTSGYTLHSIAFDPASSQKTDVTMRLNDGTAHPEDISQLMISDSTGVQYPILSLGRLELKPNPTQITRENGQRTLNVSAAVIGGHSITETNARLEAYANSLNLPSGYEWKTGGLNEENAKSIQSILEAMVLSSVLILITMVIQFGSFRQAIIVLIVIPLAVSSVFLAFSLTGTPLSFPALIGVLSLFGIVVTNSMFIVDKINLNLREGMEFQEAIADAGASRMEPIILTKLCAVLGLLPITLSNPLWQGLGGAIISGLLIASSIMLLFIPVLYAMIISPDEVKYTKDVAQTVSS